ncbi:MAG: NAD-dependent epimerase/dehydratase family protein [Spirochaetes bacterium]|nr:NAD-dependent epimerase/dehydratase family protein [Spirochaetota bacterium]
MKTKKSPKSKRAKASPAREVPIGPACLVTGAAGFLGHALVRALRERGYVVHAHDVRPMPEYARDRRIKVFVGDIRDGASVSRAARGCQTVFHTAVAMTLLGVVKPSLRESTFAINLGGTENVLRACREARVRRLVYTSTNTVCFSRGALVGGDEGRPYTEKYLDVYAASKALAEKAVLAADGKDGLRTVSIRPAGLWGPDERCYMMKRVIQELAGGKLVATIGDGKGLADNTHVVNVVSAELLAAEKLASKPDLVGGKAYFVTDEEPMNLWQWFRPMIEALGYRLPKWRVPASLMYFIGWIGEWTHRFGGPRPAMSRLEVHNLTTSFTFKTDRARRDLGYRPVLQHRAGMEQALPWARGVLAEALAKKA